MFSKFVLKDIVFLAILSAILLLVSGLIMPIVMFTQIYALRQLVSSPIFAMFCSIALFKVPKIGSLSIIGIITGSVLLFLSPVMFFNQLIAAFFVEIIILLFFKNYTSDQAIITASALYVPTTLPITLLYNLIMKDLSIADQVKNTSLTVLVVFSCLLLGFIGAIFGKKITTELQRAGKL